MNVVAKDQVGSCSVQPDCALGVAREAGSDGLDVFLAKSTTDDNLDAVLAVLADLLRARNVVGSIAEASGGEDTCKPERNELVKAFGPAGRCCDGIECAMENAAKGAGVMKKLGATDLINGDLFIGVFFQAFFIGLHHDAKDKAIAADGVHEAHFLEVFDGLDHLAKFGGRVDEVRRPVGGRATGSNHDTNGNIEPLVDACELRDGWSETSVFVGARGIEFDAGSPKVLGEEGLIAGEYGDLEVEKLRAEPVLFLG
jgi:hypothetical protein